MSATPDASLRSVVALPVAARDVDDLRRAVAGNGERDLTFDVDLDARRRTLAWPGTREPVRERGHGLGSGVAVCADALVLLERHDRGEGRVGVAVVDVTGAEAQVAQLRLEQPDERVLGAAPEHAVVGRRRRRVVVVGAGVVGGIVVGGMVVVGGSVVVVDERVVLDEDDDESRSPARRRRPTCTQ